MKSVIFINIQKYFNNCIHIPHYFKVFKSFYILSTNMKDNSKIYKIKDKF
jgi:hypothetical protein